MRSLAMYAPRQDVFINFVKACHQLLWWATIDVELCKNLAHMTCKVLQLSPSSNSVKRSFKIRCRIHEKNCSNLDNEKANTQPNLIYNAQQIQRIGDGARAASCDTPVCNLLVEAYGAYVNKNSSTLTKALSMLTASTASADNCASCDIYDCG